MATFEYNALTSGGRLMKGTIEAGSQEDGASMLAEMGLVVNTIGKAKVEKPRTAIGRNEFLLFNQQLAAITKAGIPLERGLRELAEDVASKSMRKLIDAIADELEGGASIEEAFEKRQKRFPPLYGRILKAGVETGRLSEMLMSLNRHLEIASQTRRIVFEAISYPAVILALGAIIMTGVVVFVIPQFATIITEMMEGEMMNPITRAFFAMSEHVVVFWMGFGLVVAAVVFIFGALSSTAAGRRFRESIVLRIPVLGRLCHSSSLSKMAEAMAMMVAAGCDMPTCLRLGSTASGSDTLLLEGDILAGQIEKGENILEAGVFCRMIPKLFLYSVQLGAQRNELQDNLYSLGQMYAEQTRYRQARLQAILLPVMLIVVGGFMALTVLAIFMPMVQVISSLSAMS